MVDNSDREQSEFNMAVSYLNRLNSLFYACDEAAMGLDAHAWYSTLLCIFRELSTEMKEPEIKSLQKTLFKELQSMVMRNQQMNDQQGNKSIPQKLYEQLHNFEMKLRNVLKGSGLQMRTVDDAGRALR